MLYIKFPYSRRLRKFIKKIKKYVVVRALSACRILPVWSPQ